MKRNITIVGLTICLALLALNFLASRHFVRWDMTANNDYTLSPATKKILKNLNDVVTVRVYFTQDMPPQLQAIRRLIDDMLGEYRIYADKNVQIEYIDPAETDENQREAAIAGITPLQVNVQGQGKLEVTKIHLGMAVMHGGKREVIPLVANPQNLEYDLTSRILKLTTAQLPVLVWWGPTGAGAAPDGYQVLHKELEIRYQLQDVDGAGTPLLDPKRVATVLVVSPQKWTDVQRKILDEYLKQGGHVVALVDTVQISPDVKATPLVSGAETVLAAHGIAVNSDLVMDRANAYAFFSGGGVNYQLPYPFWVKVLPKNEARDNMMISALDGVVLPWTSSLTPVTPVPADVTVTVLAKTTDHAKVQKATDGYDVNPETAGTTMQDNASGAVLPVVAMAENSKTGAKLVVVGTSRLAQNQFAGQFPQGAALIANAVDLLTVGDQLVGIRSRSQLMHPIEELSPLAENIIRYANMVGGVILVLVLGAVVVTRGRARQQYWAVCCRKSPL